jgi:hypothetical protein
MTTTLIINSPYEMPRSQHWQQDANGNVPDRQRQAWPAAGGYEIFDTRHNTRRVEDTGVGQSDSRAGRCLAGCRLSRRDHVLPAGLLDEHWHADSRSWVGAA